MPALLALLLAVAGCGPEPAPSSPRRLIEALDRAVFESDHAGVPSGSVVLDEAFDRIDAESTVVLSGEVLRLAFADLPAEVPGSGPAGGVVPTPGGHGLALSPPAAVVLTRSLPAPEPLSARVELRGAGCRDAQVLLYELERVLDVDELRDPRRLSLALDPLVVRRHVFELAQHAGADDTWGPGAFGLLDVRPRSTTRAVLLMAVALDGPAVVDHLEVATRPPASRLAQPSDVQPSHPHAHRVAVDGVAREAVVLAAPSRMTLPLVLPPRTARLRLHCARLPGEDDHAVDVTVTVADAGPDPGSDGVSVSATVARGPGPSRWEEWELDLSGLAGRAVALQVEARVREPAGAASVGVALGTPTLELDTPEIDDLDVVLVSLDTLRADRTSLHGHDRPTTPRLAALAAEAAVFEDAVSSSSWTLPSHASLFTGQLPARHGALSTFDRLQDDGGTRLAASFQARGYRTEAFTAGGYVHPAFGFAAGFERYGSLELAPAAAAASEGGAERAAEQREQLRALLTGPRSRPLFLFVHTYAAHSYRAGEATLDALGVSDEVRSRLPLGLGPRQLSDVLRLAEAEGRLGPARHDVALAYDAAAREADVLLGEVLDALEAGGRADRTLLIVTSDHGEELFEHGRVGHGASLAEELIRVPLVVRGPGIVPRRIAQTVSLVDLAPTLSELFGLGLAPGALDGRSLVPLLLGGSLDPAPVVAQTREEVVLRGDGWKLRHVADAPGGAALYHLAQDPDEDRDVAAGHPERLADMRAFLDRRLEQAAGGGRAAARPDLDAERLRELRALGYLGDG